MRHGFPKLGLLTLAGIGVLLTGIPAIAQAWRDSPPVPADNPVSPAKAELGRRLFYDADLSVDGTMSCATCHEQKHGFADGNRAHPGALDDPGRRNVPGLANVAWLARLTWADPGQDSLETQVAVPVFGEHPVEMGMKGHESEIAVRLGRDACYVQMFRSAFPEDGGMISFGNVAKAIATFERTLVSRDNPYDRFLRGEGPPPSAAAQQGKHIFDKDCAACHSGPDYTDAAYHRIAANDPSFRDDPGLSEVTGKARDIGKFRTPILRNIGVTAPYLHDGSAASIADAIRHHDTFAAIPAMKLNPLLAFLGTLTDERFLTDPALALPSEACGRPL